MAHVEIASESTRVATPSAAHREPASEMDAAMDAVAKRVEQMSSLPQVAAEVVRAASDPSCCASDIRKILESDPALSARVIQCVNSAAYGLRDKVSNLQRAISYLGLKEVRNLAVTASVAGVFKRDDKPIGGYHRDGLWRHMVSVAVVSRMIAKRCELRDFEEVFLSGLLHDIGIVLEDQYCHERFAEMIQGLSADRSLCEQERAALGFDHAMLGERIAKQWKFAGEVTDAIRYHHDIETYTGESLQAIACVDIANLLCGVSGRSSVGMNLVKPKAASMAALGLERTDLKVLLKDLEQEIAEQEELFGLVRV